jgi:hypothetical protein
MPHVVTLIRSASLSSVAEYAYAATAPAGSRLIFRAGACPLNNDGSTAAAGDYAGQAVHDVPSTLMGVTVLGYTDQLVEIEAVAAVVDS